MNLYKEVSVESYGHCCFLQKMFIENPKARLLFLQDHYGNDIVDSQVINAEEFSKLARGEDYIAWAKVFRNRDGQVIEDRDAYGLIFEFDFQDYFRSIYYQIHKIMLILRNEEDEKRPSRFHQNSPEFKQLNYLIYHDELMPGVEPCEVVKEVVELHNHYLQSEDLNIAYHYEKYLRCHEEIFHFNCRVAKDALYLLKKGVKNIIEELGYHEDMSWVDECYEYQLERIFDFPWENERPSYETIKETIIRT